MSIAMTFGQRHAAQHVRRQLSYSIKRGRHGSHDTRLTNAREAARLARAGRNAWRGEDWI